MSLWVVYCPACGEGFYGHSGVRASVLWAEHWGAEHAHLD